MLNTTYGEYLASREWSLLREAVRQRSRGWCERCAVGKHEDTHHLTYERVGCEELDDLLAVCRECHEFLSGKTDRDPANEVFTFVVAVAHKNIKGLRSITDGVRLVGTTNQVTVFGSLVSRMPTWTDDKDKFLPKAPES